MTEQPRSLPRRTVGEWRLESRRAYAKPFADVLVEATFAGPDGRQRTVPAFYAGDGTWTVRFNPGEVGDWEYRTAAHPDDPDLATSGRFEVVASDHPGFLTATPGAAWGFCYESGDPAFLFGDTVYNLFGVAHCDNDVTPFLQRRAEQGFNLLRVRVPVSPFHPPDGYSHWQTRRTWPWGGSEQAPLFDQFDLAYFDTVDAVVREAERLGLGLEVIMEAWGFEFPFNSRQIFVPEWEELWLRYLVARYDAFSCVYFWTLQNEYEYYPTGNWHYDPTADRWAMRVGRWMKRTAPHGHIVSIHNGPRQPPFADRFRADPDAIDAIAFQEWGTRGQDDAWLAAGIEESIDASLAGWSGSAFFAEYGYERNPDLAIFFPGHRYCDVDHTRRGAWRGAFRALGVVHGWENSWGPYAILDKDQPGMAHLLHVRRFFTQVVAFADLRPADAVVADADEAYPFGHRPLALADHEGGVVVVYLPVGGTVQLRLPQAGPYELAWFDPRSGELSPQGRTGGKTEAEPVGLQAPLGGGARPWDWVAVLSRHRLEP